MFDLSSSLQRFTSNAVTPSGITHTSKEDPVNNNDNDSGSEGETPEGEPRSSSTFMSSIATKLPTVPNININMNIASIMPTSFHIIPNERKNGDDQLQYEDYEDDELGSPIVILLYDFFTEPESGKYAYWWSLATCFAVIIRILEIGIESVNGPNQYSDRAIDRSRYSFLLSDEKYFQVYIICFVLLIIDGFGRVVLMVLLMFEEENRGLYLKFKKDFTERFLFFADTAGLLPFFITAGYVRPNSVTLNQGARIVMRVLELLTTGRIFRAVKHVSAVRAIVIALTNAFQDLVLPVFFFFVFNITAGVFFYFAEPCYDASVCPWINLFESTFYSIVTMTTTGYGNQVPSYEFGRFVACCVMLFGALYLSLPLAIIGNEYDRAWTAVQEEVQSKKVHLTKDQSIEETKDDHASNATSPSSDVRPSSSEQISNDNVPVLPTITEDKELVEELEQQKKVLTFWDKKGIVQDYSSMILADQILSKISLLVNDIQTAPLSTKTIIALCEVGAWLPTYQLSIEETFRSMFLVAHKGENANVVPSAPAARRFSIVHGGANLSLPSSANRPVVGTIIKPILNVPFSNPFVNVAKAAPGFVKASPLSVASIPIQETFIPKKAIEGSATKDEILYFGESSEDESLPSNYSMSDEEWSDEEGQGHAHHHHQSEPDKIKKRKSDGTNQIVNDPVDESKTHLREAPLQRSSSSESSESDDSGSVATRDAENENENVNVNQDVGKEAVISKEIVVDRRPIQTQRNSMYKKMLTVIGVQDKFSRRRTVSEEFLNRVKKVSETPDSFKSRIWILLELPHSSKEARSLQLLMVGLVCLSIFILYTQTITSLTLYGESRGLCGTLVEAYCQDKGSSTLDPACFVQDQHGPTSQKLSFGCDFGYCYGHGLNFGSLYTNMTCVNATVAPFQLKNELIYTYGKPYLFTSREEMHRIMPVCSRLECIDNSAAYVNGQPLWVASEFLTNIIFSVELVLRISVAESLAAYWHDKMNLFDIFAVLPFYTEVFTAARQGFFDFSILSSSPEPIILVMMRSLKLFRLFKLTRHFHASKVLVATAKRVWKQIAGMLGVLVFMVTLFSIVFFEMERGRKCYVGDSGCDVPAAIADVVHVGDVIYINKNGEPSQFPNVFFGVWFSFVTLTTVGYGDIVPVTSGGQVMAIFLMLAGMFYMAMPLTAAASTFYQEHEAARERREAAIRPEIVKPPELSSETTEQKAKVNTSGVNDSLSFTSDDHRLLISVRYSMAMIRNHEVDIQKIVDELHRHIGHDPNNLRNQICDLLRRLEENINDGERDLVDLLLRYTIIMGGGVPEELE